jgi:predicted permease
MPILRDVWRALRATPVVTAAAVLSLALGIGANTAIFSIINSLLVRTLPVREPQRLVQVFCGPDRGSWTNPLWEQVRNRPDLFDGAFAWTSTRFNLSQGGQTDFVPGIWASGRFFDVLGVPAILGRTFTPAEDARGGRPDGAIAVISYGLWQRRFAGSTGVIGKVLTIQRVPYTIVGVTPPDFFGPQVGSTFDVVLPIGTEPLQRGKESYLDRRGTWWLRVMARLKPQQSLDAGIAALRHVQPQIREATLPPDWRAEELKSYMTDPFTLVPAGTGTSSLRTNYRQPLYLLMGIVALVLLIACANVANLLLARAAARRHEFSVRLALGASGWRISKQLLVESLALSGAGAALGIVLALWGSRLLVRQLSTQANVVFLDLSLDWRVLAFTTAVAMATALIFGLAPAMQATRIQPMESIKEQGRTIAAESRVGFGSALVVAQISLSLVLVVGAGLFMRTFSSLAALNLGFDRDPILTVGVSLQTITSDDEARRALYQRVLDATRAEPGVASASLSAIVPVSGSMWNTTIQNPPGLSLTGRQREMYVNHVSPDWFRTYGTPIVAGRDITDRDTHDGPPVTLINETAARRFFSGANPIGQTIRQVGDKPTSPPIEIVGVVKDAAYSGLREMIPATMYRPFVQESAAEPATNLSVRTAARSPALLTRGIASALGSVNPNLALTFRPLADQIKASYIRERMLTMVSGFFGGVALLLAGIGLYGVMSYAVTRRRLEIGIRLALGASPNSIIRLVLRRVVVLVLAGVIVGGTLSLWLGKFIGALLFNLQPRDPATLAGAIAVLAGIGLLASAVPAWRASRIDPTKVLREG